MACIVCDFTVPIVSCCSAGQWKKKWLFREKGFSFSRLHSAEKWCCRKCDTFFPSANSLCPFCFRGKNESCTILVRTLFCIASLNYVLLSPSSKYPQGGWISKSAQYSMILGEDWEEKMKISVFMRIFGCWFRISTHWKRFSEWTQVILQVLIRSLEQKLCSGHMCHVPKEETFASTITLFLESASKI